MYYKASFVFSFFMDPYCSLDIISDLVTKLYILPCTIFSNILAVFDTRDIGLELEGHGLLTALCTGITSANFSALDRMPFSIPTLNLL